MTNEPDTCVGHGGDEVNHRASAEDASKDDDAHHRVGLETMKDGIRSIEKKSNEKQTNTNKKRTSYDRTPVSDIHASVKVLGLNTCRLPAGAADSWRTDGRDACTKLLRWKKKGEPGMSASFCCAVSNELSGTSRTHRGATGANRRRANISVTSANMRGTRNRVNTSFCWKSGSVFDHMLSVGRKWASGQARNGITVAACVFFCRRL